MLRFDRYLCLISDHLGSACRACMAVCYQEAFSIQGGRIRFDQSLCTDCGGCIGGCPTEAMALEGFDEDHFALLFAGSGKRLSCKENTPCLAVFGAEHLALMALRSKAAITCDLASCEGCEYNPAGQLSARITGAIDSANHLLLQLGLEALLQIQTQKDAADRRGFFKKLLHSAARSALSSDETHKPVDAAVTPVPKRRILLQNALQDFDTQILDTIDSPLIADRAISDACTACGDCIRICPTRALNWEENGAALTLQANRCIDCDLCSVVCKPHAIARPEKIDARAYIAREKKTLKTFNFTECAVCGMPFAAAPGVSVCTPCREYAQDYGDMFTPAWQLEKS